MVSAVGPTRTPSATELEEWCRTVFDADVFSEWIGALSYVEPASEEIELHTTNQESGVAMSQEEKSFEDGVDFVHQKFDMVSRMIRKLQHDAITESMATPSQWICIFVEPAIKAENDDVKSESSEDMGDTDSETDAEEAVASRWAIAISAATSKLGELLAKAADLIPLVEESANPLKGAISDLRSCIDSQIDSGVRTTKLTAMERERDPVMKTFLQSSLGQHMMTTTRTLLKKEVQHAKARKKASGHQSSFLHPYKTTRQKGPKGKL